MRIVFLTTLVLFISITKIHSQDQNLVKFFDTIIENDIDIGFDTLLSDTYFEMTDSGKESEQKIINVFKAIEDTYGKIEEYEINRRMKIFEYFSYHKYSPVHWKFIMYNYNNKWIVINLEMDYDINNVELK